MLDRVRISNEFLEVSFKTFGAELCSVKDRQTGFEYIWQAGSAWPKHAPVLFPIVGSLKDHEFTFKGEPFSLTHHGFARDLQFDVLHQSEHSIAFVLGHDKHSLASYPFPFTFLLTYSLSGRSLSQKFRLLNEGEQDMPFSWGAHPAFAAEPIDEYSLSFEADDDLEAISMEVPYIGRKTNTVGTQGKLLLDRSTFDDDALIFHGLKSKRVLLKHNQSAHSVELAIDGWPYLGIWAKPAADFVCIEPWEGLADRVDHSKRIEDKEGIRWLKAGQAYSNSFTMTFNS